MAVSFSVGTSDDLYTTDSAYGTQEYCALMWWWNLPSGNTNNNGGVVGFGGFSDYTNPNRNGLVWKQNSTNDLNFSFSWSNGVTNIATDMLHTSAGNQDSWQCAGFTSESGPSHKSWNTIQSTTTNDGSYTARARGTVARQLFLGSRPAVGAPNFSVRLARVCFWEWTTSGTVWTDAHWQMFNSGVSPIHILPQYLVSWHELHDPSNMGWDLMGRHPLDNTGGSPSNYAHPWDKLKLTSPPIIIQTHSVAAAADTGLVQPYDMLQPSRIDRHTEIIGY